VAEKQRKSAEEERDNAEALRLAEEKQRQDAEKTRDAAEQLRRNAEHARQTAEETRSLGAILRTPEKSPATPVPQATIDDEKTVPGGPGGPAQKAQDPGTDKVKTDKKDS